MRASACASGGIEQYRDARPGLDLTQYLNGRLEAWGMFQGRDGRVQKHFHVAIDARWAGNVGIIDEDFSWSDGSRSRRVWTLTRQARALSSRTLCGEPPASSVRSWWSSRPADRAAFPVTTSITTSATRSVARPCRASRLRKKSGPNE